MTRGRPNKELHPRTFVGWAERAEAVLAPWKTDREPYLVTSYVNPALTRYREMRFRLRADMQKRELEAAYPTSDDELIERLALEMTLRKSREAYDAYARPTVADAAKARRKALVVGVAFTLVGLSGNTSDVFGRTAAVLGRNMPEGENHGVLLAQDIEREIERFIRANLGRWLGPTAYQPDEHGFPPLADAAALSLMIRAHCAFQMFKRFEPRLAKTGTDREAAEAKIQAIIDSGELFEVALEVETVERSDITVEHARLASTWLLEQTVKTARRMLAGKGYRPKHRSPGDGFRAVVFGETA
ncbi:hypothetical protein GGE45_003575 [Rhizobium aethiopicum]|uniref:Uncharacterized protein n=1 Tax=Rhizobium aethiopicum TaxID=1138170 RepID=A0A7W6QAM9_9HYPH|nr:hypothetical protein [Rhizobium aethiopicum]MBB4194048.1 hypothetical protein [Rhizobium aethiopicum]MBB4581231.1 hypothetical protein [Rhizobium aethiopicum]